MSGLVDGRSARWDFVAVQHHAKELKAATSGVVAATKPTPQPEPTPPPRPPNLPGPTVQAVQAEVLEQTRLIARMGMAARDLGHAIAENLRRLNTQEDTRR